MNTKGGSRDSKSARGGKGGPPAVINLNINTNIELHKTENAWKPDLMRKSEVKTQEEDPLLELERQVRSILNKLTPQKFDKLVKLFNELVIDSEVKLSNSIELIFEKVSNIDHDDLKSFMSLICQILLFLVHIFFLLWILDKSIILKSGKC